SADVEGSFLSKVEPPEVLADSPSQVPVISNFADSRQIHVVVEGALANNTDIVWCFVLERQPVPSRYRGRRNDGERSAAGAASPRDAQGWRPMCSAAQAAHGPGGPAARRSVVARSESRWRLRSPRHFP